MRWYIWLRYRLSATRTSAEFYRVNVIGTLNLLEALAETGRLFHRVILASSANVYGRSAQEVNPETICPAPVNHYGCSKLAMEHLAMGFRDRLPLMAVRPFNYTGRGQDANFLVPKIVEHFRKRKDSIELGNIDVRREFNDVRMVCEVYGRLLQADGTSPIVNLCSGLSHRLTDVLELMQEIAGYDIDVQVNPAFVRANELPDLRGDPARLIECIGPLSQYSLRDTLQWMYEA